STSAWRAMRAAALSTRGVGVGTGAWLALADEGLARVGSRAGGGPDAAKLKSDVRPTGQALRQSLKRRDPPATFTFVLLALGALAFFGGAGVLAARPELWSWRAARVPAIIAAAGLVLYVVACLR